MSLYERNRTLTKTDHDLLVEQGTGVESVLEFGPGYSTFAFIEAKVPIIVGLEHDEVWYYNQKKRFEDYENVRIDWYYDEAPVARVPDWLHGKRFDLAFVDSPKGYAAARVVHPGQADCSRLNTCLAALKLAPVVLLHDAKRPLERATLCRLERLGHKVEWVGWPGRYCNAWGQSYGLARVIRNGKLKKQDGPCISGSLQPGGSPAGE